MGVLTALVIVVPSFSVGQVVQLLGISSVAIGFAFRDILQNFLARILLLLTQPFRIGDQIVAAGFEGRVEDIETRATFIPAVSDLLQPPPGQCGGTAFRKARATGTAAAQSNAMTQKPPAPSRA